MLLRGGEIEIRVKQGSHEDLLRMRFFMLFAEGVIPPPSDGLPRPCPLSCQQGPVKLGIHWNQKKLAVLKPAFLQAFLQAIQLLRVAITFKDQLAEDWVHTVNS